jgi:PTS system glucose-specific IIC component
MKFSSVFALLQKIGKSLMLPVSVLPVAGILLGVGSAHFGWIPVPVSTIMAESGGAIFGNLPLIFALSVALGLAENDGVAALAGTVGFVVMVATLGVMAQLMGHDTVLVMGMKSTETGVFGGIVIGAIAAYLFKRFYRVELPAYLSFFAGKRSVPILTAFAAIAVGMILSVIWPPIQSGIDHLSKFAAYGNPTFAAALYGVVERLLVPFGLHHIWNVPFFFEIGSYTDPAGKVVHGDIHRFFAGDPTAGILGGAYLFKMFGLPGAAIAMWHCARPEQKDKIGSIMVSAALASFLTGITEPIEFSFLFVAPFLYFVHALMAAGCQVLFGIFGAKLGFTFSQGFIDYALYYSIDTKPWLVMVFGPPIGILYYVVFRTIITRFDLKTPGRELITEDALIMSDSTPDDVAVALIRAFGGPKNLKSLDACITRLRMELHDATQLNAAQLKELGASGVVIVGSSVQAIFGPRSENLKSQMEAALKSGDLSRLEPIVKIKKTEKTKATAASIATEAPTQVFDVQAWLKDLGGAENVVSVAVCAFTRIRVAVKDTKKINVEQLRRDGVQDVMRIDESAVHLIVGLEADTAAKKLATFI